MKQNNIGVFMDRGFEIDESSESQNFKPEKPMMYKFIGEKLLIEPKLMVQMKDLEELNIIQDGKIIFHTFIKKDFTSRIGDKIKRKLNTARFVNKAGGEILISNTSLDDIVDEVEEFFREYRQKFSEYSADLIKWEEEYGELEPDEVQEQYLKRCRPEFDVDIANEVEDEIREKGYGTYITDILNNMILGDKKDCIRELNILFGICNGQKDSSAFIEAIGDSEEGKSWMQEVILKYFIPEENVFNAQFLTAAVMRDYDGRFFDRKIVYRGDLGHATRENFEDPSFDIAKQLITDKKVTIERRKIAEEGKIRHVLKADTFGMMYSSVVSLTKFNNQLSSRTTGFTPQDIDKEKIFNFQAELGNDMSPEKKLFDKSVDEAKRFQEYMKMCINMDIKITVEHMKGYLFKMVESSGRPELVRMGKRLLNEFKSYCYLTYYELINVGENTYIPSLQQLTDFIESSIGETFVDILDYNFMQMLVNGAAKLQPLTDTMVDNCISEAIETSMLSGDEPKKQRIMGGLLLTIDDLNDKSDFKRFRREFQDTYTLRRSIKETVNSYFFNKSNLERVYGNSKSMNDMKHRKDYLYDLFKKGYLGKVEGVKTQMGQNFYYVCNGDVCLSIDKTISEEDINNFNELLMKYGIDYQY